MEIKIEAVNSTALLFYALICEKINNLPLGYQKNFDVIRQNYHLVIYHLVNVNHLVTILT